MIQDFIDMDTQEKIRYVSESSNASTSGYSTMSPGPLGNISPASSVFPLESSPMQSPATALQTEFSNLNLPGHSPQQHTLTHIPNAQFGYPGNNYMNFRSAGNTGSIHQSQFGMQALLSNASSTSVQIKKEYKAELRILEHPVEKFRFRYKSEMHGTHGSLNGANSKRTPKTFPEVELCNFHEHAVIRCSLFQTNLESPHSHQLVVRKDDQDICDPHDLHVSSELGYVAQFQNMGIIHTAKKFIFDELLRKKRERLCFEFGRSELSTKQMQELSKETEKEAKDMNLNQVRLCFEAFKVENNCWTRIAAPVFTNPINNRKSAQTGELRICRLSIATGSVSGGDDLILLVEKVSKKNIKIRFYQLDEDEDIVWEAFGRFRESDVHHQYAIVCQTPPYKDKDIDKPVEVCIELVRPSDDERSYPPVTFRYKPRDAIVSRKRRRTCSTTTSSSSSGSSLSLSELPKFVQEQAANLSNGIQIGTNTQNMSTGTNIPTLSEEYKDQELKNLIGSENFRSIILSNSEELAKLCPDDLPDLTLLEGNGFLENDGTSSNTILRSELEHKQRILKALPLIEAGGNPYLQKIFKIYEETRSAKNINDENLAIAGKKVADVFNEHAEKNEHGDTLIHEIISNDNFKVRIKTFHILSFFKLNDLLNRTLNSNGESGLHCACIHDRALYIRPLLGLGCDPNIQDLSGNTALHIAVKEQHQKCIDSFLNINCCNFDLTIRNDEGFTPLHLAIRLNNVGVVEKLLKHNRSCALVCTRKDGNNALHMAVLQQSLELVKLILDKQNLDDILVKPNAAGYTALELAKGLDSKAGNIFEYLSTLYKNVGAKIEIKDEVLSSSTEEEDSNGALEVLEVNMIKQECASNVDEDEEKDRNEDESEQTLTSELNNERFKNILNDAEKFEKLVKLLDQSNRWKILAKRSKMQHLLCLWTNAESMLQYVRKNVHRIKYEMFVTALAEVDKESLEILRL